MPTLDLTVPGPTGSDASEFPESTGSVDCSGSNITIISEAVAADRSWGFFRWAVPVSDRIPLGSIITVCTLTVRNSLGGAGDFEADVHFEDVAAPAICTGAPNFGISSRARTTASAFWDTDTDPIPGNADGTSPDLTAVLQELVNTFDLAPALAIICVPNTTVGGGVAVESALSDSVNAGRLHIEYVGGRRRSVGLGLLYRGTV